MSTVLHIPPSTATAQRQSRVLRWGLAGSIVLVLGYLIGLVLESRGWVTYQFRLTVLWCTLPYAASVYWLYDGAYLPWFEESSVLVVATTAPYLATLLGFAALQQPYSRGAVLLVYLLALGWLLLGVRRHPCALRLLYLDAQTPQRLNELLRTSPRKATHRIVLEPWQHEALPAGHANAAPPSGVIIDLHATWTAERESAICALHLQHVRLYSVESVAELLSGRKILHRTQDLWALDRHPAYESVKRLLDTAAVTLLAPLWVPLCAVAGLAVRLDSPGGMLFSQLRMGRNGRPFRIWKLRTMQATPSDTAAFAQVDDRRITRIGQFLRRTRIDELPQLWNVLRGDMSLIGPRPEQVPFVEGFADRIPAYSYRHLVRPGLTGWAQVQQGYASNEEETLVKLSYDLYYLEHYSLSLDLLIAYKTLRIVVSGFGAR